MAWRSIADLLGSEGEVALIGAPLERGSVTPARYGDGPGTVRRALKRFSTYDLETGMELEAAVGDLGDVLVRELDPTDAFGPIRDAVAQATAGHALTLVLGGHNGITWPAVHGLGLPLDRVGLITLDAHFDLRETDGGPMNGNPVRCLLDDGLPGRNICQIGLAPFANTRKMHEDAIAAGIGVYPIGKVLEGGIHAAIGDALARLAHVEALFVDFDIDVIERSQLPGAPGARPGGMPVGMFFEAARSLAAQPQVKAVDLTELDPGLDVSDVSALAAARWVCEVLAGFARR
jgi:formiminoglutamase